MALHHFHKNLHIRVRYPLTSARAILNCTQKRLIESETGVTLCFNFRIAIVFLEPRWLYFLSRQNFKNPTKNKTG